LAVADSPAAVEADIQEYKTPLVLTHILRCFWTLAR